VIEDGRLGQAPVDDDSALAADRKPRALQLLSQEQTHVIVHMREAGHTVQAIAGALGLTPGQVQKVLEEVKMS
jgi:hypothetical protein